MFLVLLTKPRKGRKVVSASAPPDATGLVQLAENPPEAEENVIYSSDSPEVSSQARAVIHKQRNRANFASRSNLMKTSEGQRLPTRSVRSDSKRRFIDPQPNAEKVSSDTDISQDEGFEKEGRAADVAVRRNETTARKRRAVESMADRPRSPRISRDDEASDAASQQNQQNLEQCPKPSQLANLKMANQQAKMIVALQPRKTQSRKPWTDEETETLIQLIEDEGISWSRLKDKDKKKILKHRDQVALKDKARNIKFDFLKCVFMESFLGREFTS